MKWLFKSKLLITALLSLSVAVCGCGSDDEGASSPNGGGGPGTPGFAGGILQLPGGAVAIPFQGSNAYDSGVALAGSTSGFTPPGYLGYGVNTLSLTPVGIAPNQPGTLNGRFMQCPNSNITILRTGNGSDNLHSNIVGLINLDPTCVQNAFAGSPHQVLGIAIDVVTTGSSIYGGLIWVNTPTTPQGHRGFYLSVF